MPREHPVNDVEPPLAAYSMHSCPTCSVPAEANVELLLTTTVVSVVFRSPSSLLSVPNPLACVAMPNRSSPVASMTWSVIDIGSIRVCHGAIDWRMLAQSIVMPPSAPAHALDDSPSQVANATSGSPSVRM